LNNEPFDTLYPPPVFTFKWFRSGDNYSDTGGLAPDEKWPVSALSRKQQINLQFLIENQRKIPQQVMVYAKKWVHEL
jgi:hypothetical protein